MANFDDIKSVVIDTVGTVAEKTRDLAGNVADRAKDVSRVAKLNIEITQEKESVKKAYTELGKLYYETHKEDPDPFCIQLCDEVTMALDSIAAKEAEIAEIKAKNAKAVEEDEDDEDAAADDAPSAGAGGLTLTKSAPRQRATPAAPAMRSGSFSAVTALPRG